METLKVNDIVKVPINNIYVNHENPRHEVVMDLGENFIMQQLVSTKKDAQAMYKLMCDIYNGGWFPQSVVTVTYDKEKDKYIAWDGNRRITALKILQTPKLVDSFKHFTYTQIQNIYKMNKSISDSTFYEVSCYIATSFEDCSEYIRTTHTTDTGALQWTQAAKKRFENKLGKKNIFSQLQEYCPEPFKNISDDFSVNKFEKIATSKSGKDFLNIDNIDNILTTLGPFEELEKNLTKIIRDIDENIIKNSTIENNNKIENYLKNFNSPENNIEKIPKKTNIEQKSHKEKQFTNIKEMNPIKLKNPIQRDKQLSMIQPLKTKLIRRDSISIFSRINVDKLNKENSRSIGVHNLCFEIQKMSISQNNKIYRIAFCHLVRSLFEQSSIYFLIQKDRWDKLVEGNNNRDLRLESIIKEIEKNKTNYFDVNTLNCWNTFNNNTSTKVYFDLIVHHPYIIDANIDIVNNISDSGLFAIIQFFINN